jgi:hypothetical protein
MKKKKEKNRDLFWLMVLDTGKSKSTELACAPLQLMAES